MKNILYIFIAIFLFIGCSKHSSHPNFAPHTYTTFYGLINTDTMQPIRDDDGTEYYIVKSERVKDSTTLKFIDSDSAMIVHFYKPCRDLYFSMVVTNKGYTGLRTYYNPYKDTVLCTEIFNPVDSSIFCLEEYIRDKLNKR